MSVTSEISHVHYLQRNELGERDAQSIFKSFINDSAKDDLYSAVKVGVGPAKKRFEIINHSCILDIDEDDTDIECLREYNELGWDDMSKSC